MEWFRKFVDDIIDLLICVALFIVIILLGCFVLKILNIL